MRVVHITATHLNQAGGIPLVLKQLVKEQNKIDSMSSMVISLVADVDQIQSEYFVHIQIENLELYLKKVVPDVVIIHSFYHFEYSYVARVLQRNGIRYYIEPHGSFMKEGMKKSHIKKSIANQTVFKKLIHSAYGFIYLCEGERKNSIFHTRNDILIPNGIDRCEYNTLKSKRIRFYYIGRYDIHEKGLDLLLDAIDVFENQGVYIEMGFFGDGDKRSKEYIRKRISKYKVVSVKDYGPIYGEAKNNILSGYNISILLSRHEGLPMTVLESWNYGNPCIVSPTTNVAEEAVCNKIGWKVELNVKDIVQGIKKAIIEYSEERDRFIEDCKQHVLSNYSWRKIANFSFEALNVVVNSKTYNNL